MQDLVDAFLDFLPKTRIRCVVRSAAVALSGTLDGNKPFLQTALMLEDVGFKSEDGASLSGVRGPSRCVITSWIRRDLRGFGSVHATFASIWSDAAQAGPAPFLEAASILRRTGDRTGALHTRGGRSRRHRPALQPTGFVRSARQLAPPGASGLKGSACPDRCWSTARAWKNCAAYPPIRGCARPP